MGGKDGCTNDTNLKLSSLFDQKFYFYQEKVRKF